MVTGLPVFHGHFAGYENHYVLIGGTAATLAMAEAGLEFRATKDLDIVLHMEAFTAAFGAAIWAFVERGAY
jgi:formylmethanofuran dehydrogenase subunit E